MVSPMSHYHGEVPPGVPCAASEHNPAETTAVPGAHHLAIAEMSLFHQPALMRAQRRPDFDLIPALAPEQQLDRALYDSVHTPDGIVGQFNAHRGSHRGQMHVVGQP